jgi:predicted transcriptional regulator
MKREGQTPDCAERAARLHFCRMSNTVTVRLPEDLAAWLSAAARRRGVSQGRIIRDQLEQARRNASHQAFMKLAGSIRGAKDLSARKGFSKS